MYVDTAAEGTESNCYNTECDGNSVVSKAQCRIDVTRLEYEVSKFLHGEAGGIRHISHRWQRPVDALDVFFEGVQASTITVFFK